MALINPETGSSRFNAVVRYNAVISLAGEAPQIISQEEEFGLKLISDASNGQELTHKDLQEVPDEEIGEDGFWIHSQAARLKSLSQEELIAMVLKLQAGETVAAPTPEVADVPAEEEAEEAAEEPVEEEKPKPKKKKKAKPAPAEEEEGLEEDELEEVAF